MNKVSKWLSGAGLAIASFVGGLVAHAQSFAVTTSTEQTNNGAYLQAAYDRTVNFLSSTGGVLFMIVIAILGVAVWLAVKSPRHIVNS